MALGKYKNENNEEHTYMRWCYNGRGNKYMKCGKKIHTDHLFNGTYNLKEVKNWTEES